MGERDAVGRLDSWPPCHLNIFESGAASLWNPSISVSTDTTPPFFWTLRYLFTWLNYQSETPTVWCATEGSSFMRQVFALAVLVACIRLWLALNTVPIGLSVSEARGEDTHRNVKGVQEPWLDAVEGIMNGLHGLNQDSRSGRATFRLDHR
jgi:hypothetical protein